MLKPGTIKELKSEDIKNMDRPTQMYHLGVCEQKEKDLMEKLNLVRGHIKELKDRIGYGVKIRGAIPKIVPTPGLNATGWH